MKKAQHEIKQKDEPVLEHIRKIIHMRPSYGYRRVTAVAANDEISSKEPLLKRMLARGSPDDDTSIGVSFLDFVLNLSHQYKNW